MDKKEVQSNGRSGRGNILGRVRLNRATIHDLHARITTQPLVHKRNTSTREVEISSDKVEAQPGRTSLYVQEVGATGEKPEAIKPWRLRTNTRHVLLKRWRRVRQVEQSRKRLVTRVFIVMCCLLVIVVSGGLGYSFNYYQSQLPLLKHLLNQPNDQATRIYDRNGQLLFTLYNADLGRHTAVDYTQIPGVLQDAQIAAEDKTFWTNSGVDPLATLRSAIVDVTSRRVETGASTITQQVIKNLSNNRGLTGQRKLSEAALAIGLTQTYPKWKILEMYFNIAPYGAQDVGVEAAIEDYFGLKPQCISGSHCIPGPRSGEVPTC